MNQLKKMVSLLFLTCFLSISYSQDASTYNPEKTVVWTKVENGFQIQLIREANHEYILRTPLELLNKTVENPQVVHYAGALPYGESYKIPEIQTPELVQSRIQSLYAGMSLDYNASVKKYVDWFLSDRRLIEESVGRSKYFLPIADSVLASKPHMPHALKYLPLVESNYKPKGYSRAGARGIWQFMRGTGKLYGLTINRTVDARLNPTKSTAAALKYLDDLYGIYGDWYLALAAYNCGPGRVNRAIRHSGIENPTFWQLQKHLPRETRNYVPKFIAAVYVMEYADQIGLLPNWDEYEEVRLEVEELYTNKFAPNHASSYYTDAVNIPENATILTYTVKSGDNLGFIAEWYDVSAKQLRNWNGIHGNLIKPGQSLTVYVPTEKVHVYEEIDRLSAENKNKREDEEETNRQSDVIASAATSNRNYIIYTIQSGDTLWDISRKNGVSLEQIKQLNNISNTRNLKPGMVIKIREKS